MTEKQLEVLGRQKNAVRSAAPASRLGASGDLVKDSNIQQFMVDVVEASRYVPVLVDFWAPWCGPCKQLTPLLEKLVKEEKGRIKLVKINIDANQQLAAQMRVQSIPAVFAFIDGQPVDGFMGALPESQIKKFIARLTMQGGVAEEIVRLLSEAQKLMSEQQFEAASHIFSQIIEADISQIEAIAGLIHCQIALANLDGAYRTLALVAADQENMPVILSAKAALELAANPVDMGEVERLQSLADKAPDDLQARFDLAIALNGVGERARAVETLIFIFKKDRQWHDEAARKQLVKFFEAWGPKDEFTIRGRRQLSSLLFA